MYADRFCWWTVLLLTGFFANTHAATIKVFDGSLTKFVEKPLDDPLPLLNSTCLNSSQPIVIYASGLNGDLDAAEPVLTAYLNCSTKCVALLDWSNEAKSGPIVALGYPIVVANAKRIASQLADALIKLLKAGLSLDRLYLMGHSLGAHVVGLAGKALKAANYIVQRITGLDPAGPFFDGAIKISDGIDNSSANCVDCIHTDTKTYGTNISVCTVDIFPNFSYSGKQPGCPVINASAAFGQDTCSHFRSVGYFSEAIYHPDAFPASGAVDYNAWVRQSEPQDITYLGDKTIETKGNHYLTTNAQSPYGKYLEGLKP